VNVICEYNLYVCTIDIGRVSKTDYLKEALWVNAKINVGYKMIVSGIYWKNF